MSASTSTSTRTNVATRALLRGTIVPLCFALSGILLTASTSGASTHTVALKKYGLTFTLPNHWQEIPLTGSDISGLLDLVTKADPSMKNSLTTEVKQAAKEGVKVFALGPIVKKFASNINVIVEPQTTGPSTSVYFDQLGVEVKLNLASAGMKEIKTSTVHWPQGEVLQATYTLRLSSPLMMVKGIQDYVWHKGKIFIVTISSSTLTADQAVAAVVSHSWRWG